MGGMEMTEEREKWESEELVVSKVGGDFQLQGRRCVDD